MTLLGYAGLLPFVFFSGLAWSANADLRTWAAHGFIVYSLTILAFLAGTLWGSARSLPAEVKPGRLLVSNLMAVFGAAAAISGSVMVAIVLLALGHLGLLAYELCLPLRYRDPWYGRLRARLTACSAPCYLVLAASLVVLP